MFMETRPNSGARAGRRVARAGAALAFLFFLGTFVRPSATPEPQRSAAARLTVETVALDPSDPARTRIGSLTFIRGYRLSSSDPRFGGISAMHVEGGEVLAVSDAGSAIRFPLPTGAGALPLRIEALRQVPGPAGLKSDRDSESMAVHGRQAWVAVENRNTIWRYRLPGLDFEAGAAPPAMRQWPSNAGAEAILRLRDGRFLVFAEGPVGEDGTSPALLFDGDPARASSGAAALRYRPPGGYRITDAALLPNGRMLFLNRRFTLLEGWSAILTVGERGALEAGAMLEGRELAALGAPLGVDNMEALSVTSEGGRTMLWIASDDNFTPMLQRSLLLGFALD